MANRTRNNKKAYLNDKNINLWYYLPLYLVAGFVPLIVYGKYINLTGTTQSLFWTGQNETLDFFSYWKSHWLIFLSVISLVIYIFLLILKKITFKKEYKYYIPLCTFIFFAILSTIFAVDTKTAVSGFMDMYQGIFVLSCYMLLTFLTINYVNEERDIKLFLHIFIFLIIVEGIIGITQYFGFDIFNSKFGNNLILPGNIKINGDLSFKFGKHTLYGTLFNTNFVGSFATLMLPMAAVFFINTKDIKKRVIASAAILLCVFIWLGCNSRAGYIGVMFTCILSICLFRKYIIRYWKISLSMIIIAAILLLLLNVISNGKVVNQISRLNIFKEINNMKISNTNTEKFIVENIEVGQDFVNISTNHQNLNIRVKDGKLIFIDEDGLNLPFNKDDSGALIIDDGSEDIYFKVIPSEKYYGFDVNILKIPNGTMHFLIDNDGIKVINSGGRLSTPYKPDTLKFFDGIEKFATNRGYIWGRTIPLMAKYVLIGAGPDNFIYAFPQDDYVGKLNNYNKVYMVVDKPHNMYLQTAINTGVISLLALLILWCIYIISSLKLYWNINYDTLDKLVGSACLLGVVGYLVAGIFNDQIVSVAPLFWIVLGIGISTNSRIKKQAEMRN